MNRLACYEATREPCNALRPSSALPSGRRAPPASERAAPPARHGAPAPAGRAACASACGRRLPRRRTAAVKRGLGCGERGLRGACARVSARPRAAMPPRHAARKRLCAAVAATRVTLRASVLAGPALTSVPLTRAALAPPPPAADVRRVPPAGVAGGSWPGVAAATLPRRVPTALRGRVNSRFDLLPLQLLTDATPHSSRRSWQTRSRQGTTRAWAFQSAWRAQRRGSAAAAPQP